MSDYVTVPLQTDATEITSDKIADYQARMPGWVPYTAAPEMTLMAVQALRDAILLDVASQVLDSIYRYSGTTIDGVPYDDATFASVDSTWTLVDDAGYTIPAGLRVGIPIDGSTTADFLVQADVIVPNGSTTAAVVLIAAVAGAASSGLSGTPTLQDPRTWVASIALAGSTDGGQDAETDADYLDRLTRKRRRATDTIVTALDAQQALLDIAGIGRCQILDNHVPPSTDGVPGAFTAVICAPDGSNCSSDVHTTALTLLNADRLLALSPYVVDPIRTDVAVTYKYDVYAGWDPTAVGASGDAAVTAYANNAGWGEASTAGGATDWEDDLLFRYGEIYAALNQVQGLNHVLEVKINGSVNTDAALTGPGALPNLTSVAGTYVP